MHHPPDSCLCSQFFHTACMQGCYNVTQSILLPAMHPIRSCRCFSHHLFGIRFFSMFTVWDKTQRDDLILFPSTAVWVRRDSTTGVGLQHTIRTCSVCWTFCLYLLDWSYCLNSHGNTVCSLLTSDCMDKYLKGIPSRQDAEHSTM